MIRRIASLAAVALSATALVVMPASPASALPGSCAGQGTAQLGTGLYYPPPLGNGPITTGFFFQFTTGGCIHTTLPVINPTAGGTVTGFCGTSTGRGQLLDHNFTFQSAGSVLVISGGVVGTVNAVPDAAGGESCLKPGSGADRFIITGSIALV